MLDFCPPQTFGQFHSFLELTAALHVLASVWTRLGKRNPKPLSEAETQVLALPAAQDKLMWWNRVVVNIRRWGINVALVLAALIVLVIWTSLLLVDPKTPISWCWGLFAFVVPAWVLLVLLTERLVGKWAKKVMHLQFSELSAYLQSEHAPPSSPSPPSPAPHPRRSARPR